MSPEGVVPAPILRTMHIHTILMAICYLILLAYLISFALLDSLV